MSNEFQEKAIARYRAALSADGLPDEIRAGLQAQLALVFVNRAEGTAEENLETAIEYFDEALAFEKDATERARTLYNLGISYRRRVRGDAGNNMERAIDCFEQALALVSRDEEPVRWGELHVGVADALIAHPKRTRERIVESAGHCRMAQQVFTREEHPERWAWCHKIVVGHLATDPAVRAVQDLAARLEARTGPDDPFGKLPSQLLESLRRPDSLPKGDTVEAAMVGLIELFAGQIRKTVAARAGTWLAEDDALRIHVVPDWDLHAQVATTPPFDIYLSTNLVLFCATMSELLTLGLGYTMIDDDGEQVGASAAPLLSDREIAGHMREVIEAFLRKDRIPRIPTDPGPGHYMWSVLSFFSTMSFLVSHEFGHVITAEYRARTEPPPFHDFAQAMLEGAFDGLVAGRHHAYDTVGFEGRETMDRAAVFASWAEEIASDILGASLALEFQKESGPWSHVPDVLAHTKLGIHLALLSQMILALYCNQVHGDLPLMTATHPPMDFRTYCVLQWMYNEQHEKAERPMADYVTRIVTILLGEASRASL